MIRTGKRSSLERLEGERGATMLEYALIAACIAVVSIGTIGFVGTEVDATFDTVHSQGFGGTHFPGAGSTGGSLGGG